MDARALLDIAERRYEEFVADLERMVNVDCGSYSPQGVNAIADMCVSRFESAGWTVERRPHTPANGSPQLGDLLLATLEGGGGPSILMVGHMDTVFDDGTAAERPFSIDGDIARGPGVSDMKAGLLTGMFAVEVLQEAGVDSWGRITYVCNPDEEIGSPFSGATIRELAPRHDVAFVLEGARANGDIVSARKGITDYSIAFRDAPRTPGSSPRRGATPCSRPRTRSSSCRPSTGGGRVSRSTWAWREAALGPTSSRNAA